MTLLPLTRSELLSICEAELAAARKPAPAESANALAARAYKIERRTTRRGVRVEYYLRGNAYGLRDSDGSPSDTVEVRYE